LNNFNPVFDVKTCSDACACALSLSLDFFHATMLLHC